MWESFRDLKYRLSNGLFTEELLKGSLGELFLALDYLHTECKLVHTGARDFIITPVVIETRNSNTIPANSLISWDTLLNTSYRYQSRQYPFPDRR